MKPTLIEESLQLWILQLQPPPRPPSPPARTQRSGPTLGVVPSLRPAWAPQSARAPRSVPTLQDATSLRPALAMPRYLRRPAVLVRRGFFFNSDAMECLGPPPSISWRLCMTPWNYLSWPAPPRSVPCLKTSYDRILISSGSYAITSSANIGETLLCNTQVSHYDLCIRFV